MTRSTSAHSAPSVSEFKQFVEPLDVNTFEDDASRKQALQVAHALVRRLEKPMDTMLRQGWESPTHTLALKIAVDLNLFNALAGDEKDTAQTNEKLSATTKCDPTLLARVLRVLAANGTVDEVGESKYAPNTLSLALCDARISSAIGFVWDVTNPSFQTFPRFLAETSYKNPTDARDGPFQYAYQTKLGFFDWASTHPDILQNFGTHMSGYTSQRGTWEQIYPVQERLLSPSITDDEVVLVDMGGGAGHDLSRFASKYLPQRQTPVLVLQDLPDVISTLAAKESLPLSIKPTAHNFFESQPVKGARAYYMHSVLHDWPDTEAVKILKALHSALLVRTPSGHSPKLLVNENVLPAMGAKTRAASLDLMMCAYHAASERSEKEWRALLESAGYKITGVYVSDAAEEGIIEAEAVTV